MMPEMPEWLDAMPIIPLVRGTPVRFVVRGYGLKAVVVKKWKSTDEGWFFIYTVWDHGGSFQVSSLDCRVDLSHPLGFAWALLQMVMLPEASPITILQLFSVWMLKKGCVDRKHMTQMAMCLSQEE